MMLQIKYTKQFKKDVALSKKRNKDMCKLKEVIELLINDELLPKHLNDHQLIGTWCNHRELHITPDWLLIYSFSDENNLKLERLGSHSDLFKK